MEPRFSDAFEKARLKHNLPPSLSISIHNYPLCYLPDDVKFDTVVSPANSYGLLDGAFDDAISRAFSPRDDYIALTRVAQKKLYEQWRGFAPPGTCTLVRIPDEFHARSRNVWGAKHVALCPTMRIPRDACWDREITYEAVWSLLCAIGNHNRDIREGKAEAGAEEIRSILMTPFATGVGRVSPEKWAAQAVLAIRHYDEAMDDPEGWSSFDWMTLGTYAFEVEKTWDK